MDRTIEGVYRDGRVELLGPAPVKGDSKVIVTFLLSQNGADLAERGIGTQQAAILRQKLEVLMDDWSRPEMDVYDAL